MKLTKRTIDALALPPAGDTVLWDDGLSGFGVRVFSSGRKTFVIQYRNAHGASRRLTIGKLGEITPEEARKAAAKLLAGARLGSDPAAVRAEARNAPRIADLITAYLAEGPASRPDKKASSWLRDRSTLTCHALPLLGTKNARALVKADIERWQSDVAAGKTAVDVKTGFRGRCTVVGAFEKMVRNRTPDLLDAWLRQTGQSLLSSFARGLRSDEAAIIAAMTDPWSNGQAEGQINRLKTPKRQMYGRAKLDLLKARMIAA